MDKEQLIEYIVENQENMTLDELMEKTNLSREEIIKIIRDNFEDNKKFMFKFNIMMNVDGDLIYQLQWPDSNVDVEFVRNVGKLFYALNAGKLKESMVEFLISTGQNNGTEKATKEILSAWNESLSKENDVALVEPYEVFKHHQ